MRLQNAQFKTHKQEKKRKQSGNYRFSCMNLTVCKGFGIHAEVIKDIKVSGK